jgi:arginase
LNRLLAPEVRNAISAGRLPLVLAGNCICSLGSIAGIGSDQLGVVWFDAHGEFNTPETTLSGFLDGMPLATATGRCWKALARTIPGFAPVPDANVIMIGARDVDLEEQRQLEQSEINLVKSEGQNDEAILQSIESGLIRMQNRVTAVYLHIDMDAFEIDEGKANHYGATGGLSIDLVGKAIDRVKRRFPIKSATIASFDPAGDTNGLFLRAGLDCAKKIAEGTTI